MTLSEYLTSYLGDLVTDLNVSASAINFAVSSTLVDYGVDVEAEATDLSKLHKLAEVNIWKRLMVLNSANFDYSGDGASYKTSQIYEFCKQNWINAVNDAVEYLPNGEIEITRHRIDGRHHHDEYQHLC